MKLQQLQVLLLLLLHVEPDQTHHQQERELHTVGYYFGSLGLRVGDICSRLKLAIFEQILPKNSTFCHD
jgi:hypothetical protein